MSIRIMSKVWGLELKPAPKLILLALADNANEDGVCWPGISYISRKTGLARSTVIKQMNELVAAGFLTKQAQYSKNGFRATNLYVINIADTKSNCRTPLSPADGLPLVRETDHPSPIAGPKPSYNHQKEPIRQVGKPTRLVSVSQDVSDVFTHWQTKLNHPKAKLDNKRKRKIENALKLYSLDDLQKAVDGCSKSKFHLGENDSGVKYDSLELIFRDAEHIEKFMALANPEQPKMRVALDK